MCVKKYLDNFHKILGYLSPLTLRLVYEGISIMGYITRCRCFRKALPVKIRHLS